MLGCKGLKICHYLFILLGGERHCVSEVFGSISASGQMLRVS